MKVHILGNGPSIGMFDNSEGVRVCCNHGVPELDPDWTMIADIKAIKPLYAGRQLPCPAIITKRVKEFIDSKVCKIGEDRIKIKKVVDFIHWEECDPKWGMNSAQHAVYHSILEHNPDEIHIWGCDSLWSSSIESSTDLIVPKNLEFMNKFHIYLAWRRYWNEIFRKYPNTQFIVHGPKKPDLDEADNYSWER